MPRKTAPWKAGRIGTSRNSAADRGHVPGTKLSASSFRLGEYVHNGYVHLVTQALKPAVFHILLALAEGDSHGYAIMQAVREQSGGRVPLQTGSFYRHLSTLLAQGLVAEAPSPRTPEDPRRGIHYRLTARGRQALELERDHLASVMAALAHLKPSSRRQG